MKKYINIVFATAIAALTVISCVKEKETYEKGTPDAEDCYGVYFPKQDVIEETQILDPTQAKEAIIKVARTVSEGALTVEPVVSLSEITSNGLVDLEENPFVVPSIVFEDGQAETEIKIVFPNVKEGVQYSLHLAIEGDQITSKYSSKVNTCDLKVMCVAYQDFLQPYKYKADGTIDESYIPPKAKVTFTQGWWGETHTAYIKYYEVNGIRHCQTYDEELVGKGSENGGFWGMGEDQHLTFLWYKTDVKECSEGDGEHPHTIPAGYAAPEGAELMTFDGYQEFDFGWSSGKPVVVDYYYYQLEGGYARPYLHFVAANSLYDNASYYDNNGGFYFWILGYNTKENRGSGWSFPQDYDIIGIAEGYPRADYTLKLDAGISEYNDEAKANVVPVDFIVGPDVDMVGYTILAGTASGAAIDAEVAAIAKDTDGKYAHYVEAKGESFTDYVELDKSDIYTLVAVALDENKEAQSYASVNFKYLLADDPDAVIVDVAASTTEAFASKGYNSDISIAYTITGAGITGAIPMVYSAVDVVGAGGIDALISSIESDPNTYYELLKDEDFNGKLSAEALANANDNGYTDIYANGITPGTEYYVLVWATNGYGTKVAYDTMTTTGDPLPIYKTYTTRDYFAEGKFASRDDVIGTWNYYGTDASGSLNMREYLGKLVFTASETATEGPDDSGNYDEYVYADGLFGDLSWLEKYGMNTKATVEMDVYSGIIYQFQKPTVEGDYEVYSGAKALPEADQWSYEASYCSAFVPVADGYYAFMDVSKYAEVYNFCGLELYAPGVDWIARIWDPLMIDPAKDDNNMAPAKVNKAIAAAKDRLRKISGRISETELVGQKRVHAIFDSYMKSYKTEQHAITPAGVEGLNPVNRVQRVAAKHTVSSRVARCSKENSALVQFDMRKIMF